MVVQDTSIDSARQGLVPCVVPSPGPGSTESRVASTDELALLDALRAGDEGAYETLVREHLGPMLAVARRILRDEDAARDAVQDAFVSAFRSIGRFRERSSLSTWLYRIVVNACLMKLRRARRRPELPIGELQPKFASDGHFAEPVLEWPDSPEVLLQSKEMRTLVRAQIDRLPARYRTVVMLRDIEELSTEEVATLLGISRNAVKIRLHRARQALKALLDAGTGRAGGVTRSRRATDARSTGQSFLA